jgi:hypothetical protein
MLTSLRRWFGNFLSIALYPYVVAEMLCCARKPAYINHFLSHKVSVRLYNLTRGITEGVESYIFGDREWKQESAHDFTDQISSSFVLRGWSSAGIALDVSELCKQLVSVPFQPRLSHSCTSALLGEIPTLDPRGRWDADSNVLFSLNSFAEIITNKDIDRLASALLGKYVITSALVWASFACSNKDEQTASAQVFHVDQDYLDDLKLFINLSDTWNGDGALEYIAGSNRRRAKKIWSSGPMPESVVNSLYPPDQHTFFTGPAGSAFVSDNRGIHRDSPPVENKSKLALQVNFSRSQFGSEKAYASKRPRLSPDWPSFASWCSARNANPFAYSLLFGMSQS